MNKEVRNLIIALVVCVIVVGGGWAAIKTSSGVNPPFTVVESHSMQHCQQNDTHSEVGIIDTGDMVLVKDKNKCDIISYVEGSQTGYSTFGDYGNVIVYYRDSGNPVIHRAFLWLDYNNGIWSAPQLKNYKGEWSDSGNSDYSDLEGTLTFKHVGNVVRNTDGTIGKTVSINLDSLEQKHPHSGFLTLGDSVSNPVFDQYNDAIATDGLVDEEHIKSVAWKELPWLGQIKLMLKGDANKSKTELKTWANNSITMLQLLFVSLILIIVSVGILIDQVRLYRYRKNDPGKV